MQELISQLKENVGFVLTCLAIIVGIALLAKLAERFLPETRKVSPARRISIISICAAIAVVLHILDFPLPFLAPGFYKLDFSEVPVMLCGFFLGPSAAVVCEGIKILLKLLLKSTSTAFVGDLANFVVGCSFVLPAAIWYHIHKSKHSASRLACFSSCRCCSRASACSRCCSSFWMFMPMSAWACCRLLFAIL